MLPPRTVLLIDDDTDILDAMRELLEHEGYRVLTAPDGMTGLMLAGQEKPELVVTDMMMPGKSGFIVLDTIKQSPNPAKVVMITGTPSHHHQAYAEILGADEYLHKPFTLTRLLDVVRRLCPPPPLAVAANGALSAAS
jgi:DNA-binding response OmpR family regulator